MSDKDKKEKRVPKLRFPGFTGEWEERKFGELGSIAMNKRIFKEQTSENGEIPFYKIGTFGGEPDAYISRKLFEEYKVKYPYPKVGDILISASGSIGRTVEFTGEDEYFQDSNIVWFNHDDRVDDSFLKGFYSIVKWAGIEGSTIKRLYNNNILNTIINLPTVTEQREIGRFFCSLENLIALYECKIEHLKELKKGLLQKMFPRDGENIPEIRFPGYNDAWEKYKLGKFVERIVRKNSGNESDLPLTISARYGLIDQITYFNKRIASRDISNYYLILNGEFAYNKSTSDGFPFGVIKRLDLYERGVLSTLYIVFGIKDGKNVNSDFLSVFFDTDRWHKGVAMQASEGARNHGLLNISASDFFDVDFYIPKEAEQATVGAFFKQFDKLITLYQRKRDHFQELKKGLLQQMFV